LVDALGLDFPSAVHGRSLLPLVRGETLSELPAHMAAVGAYLAGPKNWRVGIRTAEWKYVYAPQNPTIPEELYHLEADPQEWRNLAKSRRTTAEQLRRQLLDIVSDTYYVTDVYGGEEMSEHEKKTMEEHLKEFGEL
jgi:arylsulfatase A-like enzyme